MLTGSKKSTIQSRRKEMILSSEEKKEFPSGVFLKISEKIKADILA